MHSFESNVLERKRNKPVHECLGHFEIPCTLVIISVAPLKSGDKQGFPGIDVMFLTLTTTCPSKCRNMAQTNFALIFLLSLLSLLINKTQQALGRMPSMPSSPVITDLIILTAQPVVVVLLSLLGVDVHQGPEACREGCLLNILPGGPVFCNQEDVLPCSFHHHLSLLVSYLHVTSRPRCLGCKQIAQTQRRTR